VTRDELLAAGLSTGRIQAKLASGALITAALEERRSANRRLFARVSE